MEKIHIIFIILGIGILGVACGGEANNPPTPKPIVNQPNTTVKQKDTTVSVKVSTDVPPNTYDAENAKIAPSPQKDIRAEMTREDFKKLKGAELQMQLIRPIYSLIFDNDEDDSKVIPHLTDGQKALYYFRKLDEALTSGGLENLQETNTAQLLPQATQLFYKIKHTKLGELAEKAAIDQQTKRAIPAPNTTPVPRLDIEKFNKEYSQKQDDFYKKLEQYIRQYPEEFVKFKE